MPESWGPKDWFPGGGKHVDIKAAREILDDTKRMLQSPDVAYSGDLPLGETWALTFGHHRDSDLLEESNWDTILKDLEERFPSDVEAVRFGHWGVGWVEELAVRVLGKNGRVTKAALAALEWKGKLENYPVADEEDYSRREYKETIENIKNEGGVTEKEAGEVFSWLWDHNQGAVEPRDGGGGYPKSKEILEALVDLGLRTPEGDEIEIPEPPYHDPNQAWFWPEARS